MIKKDQNMEYPTMNDMLKTHEFHLSLFFYNEKLYKNDWHIDR